MNSEDPYEPDVLQCHSRFRPPTIEVMEYRARKVWPDWDDYPPYQNEIIRSTKPNPIVNRQQYPINRVEQRYNMEIKKTREEIEEMAKRFDLTKPILLQLMIPLNIMLVSPDILLQISIMIIIIKEANQ